MPYNKIIIRRGSGIPATSSLDEYSLGWSTDVKKLYINDNGIIRVIAGKNPVFTDAANTFAADKTQIFSGPVNFTNTVTLTTSPTNNNDVTNKQYVDNQIQTYIQGLDIRESVVCATTPSETLSDWTYSEVGAPSSSGILTAPHTGVGSIDGITFTKGGMRVLVKNRPGDLNNNIYTVEEIGDDNHPAQLKQVESFDSLDAGIFVFVEQGTINQNTGWVISKDPVENKCIWTQFSGAGAQALATLSDVTLTNPALNHILYHNGTKWVNLAGPDSSSKVLRKGTTNLEWSQLELNDINKFNVSTLTAGDILYYSGSEWNNLSIGVARAGLVLKTTSGGITWDTIYLEQSVIPTSGNGSKLVAVNSGGTAFTYTDTIDGGTWS